jgi:hypothetical protein
MLVTYSTAVSHRALSSLSQESGSSFQTHSRFSSRSLYCVGKQENDIFWAKTTFLIRLSHHSELCGWQDPSFSHANKVGMPARWHVSNALLMTCFNYSLHFSSNIQYRTECTYHVLKCVPSIKVLHVLNPTKFDHSIIMPTSLESPEDTHNTTKQEEKPTLITFPAASDDYRYLRNRTAILSTVFNSQPIDVSEEDSIRAWHELRST